ncbi:helix-turn-helix domain-containing protein [Streptomyces goshikiensis]
MAQQPDQPHRRDLSDLVRGTRTKRRLSQQDIEDATTDQATGEPLISRGYLGRLERGERVSIPDEPMLRALARTLDLPYAEVAEAAGSQFWGHQTVWSPTGKTRALIRTAERLEPHQLMRLQEFMEAFLPEDS